MMAGARCARRLKTFPPHEDIIPGILCFFSYLLNTLNDDPLNNEIGKDGHSYDYQYYSGIFDKYNQAIRELCSA